MKVVGTMGEVVVMGITEVTRLEGTGADITEEAESMWIWWSKVLNLRSMKNLRR